MQAWEETQEEGGLMLMPDTKTLARLKDLKTQLKDILIFIEIKRLDLRSLEYGRERIERLIREAELKLETDEAINTIRKTKTVLAKGD
jgi:hypothetical protein